MVRFLGQSTIAGWGLGLAFALQNSSGQKTKTRQRSSSSVFGEIRKTWPVGVEVHNSTTQSFASWVVRPKMATWHYIAFIVWLKFRVMLEGRVGLEFSWR